MLQLKLIVATVYVATATTSASSTPNRRDFIDRNCQGLTESEIFLTLLHNDVISLRERATHFQVQKWCKVNLAYKDPDLETKCCRVLASVRFPPAERYFRGSAPNRPGNSGHFWTRSKLSQRTTS